MTKFGKLVSFIIFIVVLVILFFVLQKSPTVPVVNTPSDNQNIKTSDLVSFSISPDQKVSGKIDAVGVIKGGYFFEGNIIINILDVNKKILSKTYGTSTTDWMTIEPVTFKTTLDFTSLPKGPAFIEIHNDNASGLPENDKSVFIPIVIE